ncbi:MAG: hypothetical protein HFI90_06195 [Clostridia bacterium]|nr:hypothetical protein [Clostridia bacterium]
MRFTKLFLFLTIEKETIDWLIDAVDDGRFDGEVETYVKQKGEVLNYEKINCLAVVAVSFSAGSSRRCAVL